MKIHPRERDKEARKRRRGQGTQNLLFINNKMLKYGQIDV